MSNLHRVKIKWVKSSSDRHQRRKAERAGRRLNPLKERPSRASKRKEIHKRCNSQTCARI